MHRFQHTAMATQFEIRCEHDDAGYARQAARAAFEAVDRLEQQLSRFVENSDVARVNHLAAGEATIVGYETMQCLQLARRVFVETAGAFDPAKGTGFADLELVPEAFVVARAAGEGAEGGAPGGEPGPGPQIDLGAIGKGYAVDRMASVLDDWDVRRVLIDAGYSSVLALEPPPDREGWALTLSRPDDLDAVLVRIEARHRVLGASGVRKGDHIWNPRTGAPVRGRRAAWVSAPIEALAALSREAGAEDSPVAIADALSTAFMITAPDEIERCCRSHPGLEAWVLEEDFFHFPRHTPAAPGGGAHEPER